MKVIAIVIISILLIGCYQSADITDVLKATQFCEDKGGLKSITVYISGAETASCVNGAAESINKIKLRIN